MSCPNCKLFHHLCKAECCTMAPIPETTWNKNKEKIQQPIIEVFNIGAGMVIPFTESRRCPFLTSELACAIYEERPEICKMFGNETDLSLTCIYQRANGQTRQFAERKKIEKKQAEKQKKFIENEKKAK